ncbi:tetraacyldisaccharide-1-phosphate 4'-kinase [Geotalea daltonii FRC-32]|uniref:Tetraacyldisaccharide 4'-kinase n=1 Tax=Geotalea daltonii (strain DSM 22248 / JCM 15807 / FRC-32) TaxID=316067 RepID=B9M8W5_GEODF|nr:tetraacyldisaccharide 4'-kinase [Geotalea daltonii]ACM20461.1 tetraacyldisaccharide-1-phosphate 4'-kinase [Geotalea daltonii FRC-32]
MKNDLERYYKELVEGRKRGFADRCLLAFLIGCSFVYALVMRLRAIAYAAGLLPVRRLDRPVIAVGNLVAGGTGKTPTVAWLARRLMAQGKRVAVLSRGYGGAFAGAVHLVSDGVALHATAEEAGDEPLLLARSIPGIIVVVGADRYQAGLLARERCNPDAYILDDGFQHMGLHRDLNILLMDCERPLVNGRTFPAGLLREPASAHRRADLIVLTRCTGNEVRLPFATDEPVCRSSHELSGYVPLAGGALRPFSDLDGKRGVAFAGIADPAAFFDSLEKSGNHPVATLAFPDHSGYGEEEIAALSRLVAASRSEYLITTEKDAVKLHSHISRLGNVYVTPLELRFSDPQILEAQLDTLFRR